MPASLRDLRMGLPDVARLAGVQRPVVSMWRSRSRISAWPFPSPVAHGGGQEWFSAADIVGWLEATGRGQGGKVRANAASYTGRPAWAESFSAARSSRRAGGDSPGGAPRGAPGGESGGRDLPGLVVADETGFLGLTALLCLVEVGGRPLASMGGDELLDLADECDPDDTLLFAEIEALGNDLESLAAYAGDLADASFSVVGAFETLLDRRRRLHLPGVAGVAVSRTALDLITAPALALAGSAGGATLRFVDPTGGSDLLVAIAAACEGHEVEMRCGAGNDAAARLSRRRLRVHRIPSMPGWRPAHRQDAASGSDPGGTAEEILPDAVVVAHLAPPPRVETAGAAMPGAAMPEAAMPEAGLRDAGMHDAGTPGAGMSGAAMSGAGTHRAGMPDREMRDAAVLDAVNDLAMQTSGGNRVLILGPASALVDRLRDRAARRRRDDLLRTDRLRALVRLPAGLVPSRPRQRLALCALGPDFAGLPEDKRRATVADLDGVTFDAAAVDALATDLVAAMDPDFGTRAHRPAYLRPVPIRVLRAEAGSLVPAAPMVRHQPPGDRSAAALLAVAELAGRAVARLPAPAVAPAEGVQTGGVPAAEVQVITLGAAQTRGLLRVLSGIRDVDVATLPPGGLPVVDPQALRDGGASRRTVDRIAFERAFPQARFTEPGDVVFVAGARPRAMVDADGGAAVPMPARILRLRPDGGLTPHSIAAEINALPTGSGPWRSWPVRVVLISQASGLDHQLAAIQRRRAELTAVLADLDALQDMLIGAVAAGIVTLDPATVEAVTADPVTDRPFAVGPVTREPVTRGAVTLDAAAHGPLGSAAPPRRRRARATRKD